MPVRGLVVVAATWVPVWVPVRSLGAGVERGAAGYLGARTGPAGDLLGLLFVFVFAFLLHDAVFFAGLGLATWVLQPMVHGCEET